MGIKDYITEKTVEYEVLREHYENQITDHKPLCLRLYHGKLETTFSKIFYSNKDRRRRYIKISLEEALQIQKNHFCLKMVKVLTKNLKLLRKCLSGLVEPDPAEIMASMPAAYRFSVSALEEELAHEEPGKPQQAQAQAGQNNASRRDSPRVLTADGTLVKSRIEALIYNALLASGLEFRYEYPITLSGITFRPDFTIFLPKGRVIYWEHLGLLGKEGYRSDQQFKLKTYYENNITMGINLILTADSIDKSIDTQMIDEIIRGLKHMAGLAA